MDPVTILPYDIEIIWAALQAMLKDVHAPQDCLREDQWARAEELLERFDALMNEQEES